MEFGQQCCLAIILCLGIFWKCSLTKPAPAYCQLSFPNQTFPGEVVPENLKFMLFYRAKNDSGLDSGMLSNKTLCLEEKNSSILALPCDPRKESQKWFQYNRFLINIQSGKNLVPTQPVLGSNATSGPVGSQQWTCVFKKDEIYPSLTYVGSKPEMHFIVNNNSDVPEFADNITGRWGVAGSEGNISSDLDLLCEKRSAFCGPPPSGVLAFIVNSKADYSLYLHLPPSLISRALMHEPQTHPGTCYSAGSFVLLACPKGHVEVHSGHSSFKEMVCLGKGVWTDPEPLECRKRTCGLPRDFSNTIIIELQGTEFVYGQMVHYKCERDFIGEEVIDICGPDGRWIGDVPQCKHFCDLRITKDHGIITSPNYPNPYPAEVVCRWEISAPEGSRVGLWFRDFFIEPGSIIPVACRFDVLSLNDSAVKTIPEQFCGSTFPSKWFSFGNTVIVEFSSDSTYQAKGFKIEYMMWNASMTSEPVFPARNGSNVDELDQTNIHIQTEYASYVIEGLYGILVITIIFFVIMIVLAHVAKGINRKVRPTEETQEALRRQNRDTRRNAVAECRDTNAIDTLNKFSGLAVISDVNVFGRLPSMEALVEDINTFQELSGQKCEVEKRKSDMSIESFDIMPPMMFGGSEGELRFDDDDEDAGVMPVYSEKSGKKTALSPDSRDRPTTSAWEDKDLHFGQNDDSSDSFPLPPDVGKNTNSFSLKNMFGLFKKK